MRSVVSKLGKMQEKLTKEQIDLVDAGDTPTEAI